MKTVNEFLCEVEKGIVEARQNSRVRFFLPWDGRMVEEPDVEYLKKDDAGVWRSIQRWAQCLDEVLIIGCEVRFEFGGKTHITERISFHLPDVVRPGGADFLVREMLMRCEIQSGEKKAKEEASNKAYLERLERFRNSYPSGVV